MDMPMDEEDQKRLDEEYIDDFVEDLKNSLDPDSEDARDAENERILFERASTAKDLADKHNYDIDARADVLFKTVLNETRMLLSVATRLLSRQIQKAAVVSRAIDNEDNKYARRLRKIEDRLESFLEEDVSRLVDDLIRIFSGSTD